MNNAYYTRAKNYARMLDRELARDFVHQAYIDYWHRCGRDLFDEDLGRVLRCVKWAYIEFLRKKYGYTPKRTFTDFMDHQQYYHGHNLTPDLILEGKELEDHISTVKLADYKNRPRKEPDILNRIINLKYQGFRNFEISKQLNVSNALITYYLKQVMAHINNPLRTSTVPLTKKMSRRTFEERYKQDYVFDLERNCDHNESYQIVVHKDRDEYILIKEKEDVAETIARINDSSI